MATDRLPEIKQHHAEYAEVGAAKVFWSQTDIAWLIGEVEYLRTERDALALALAEARARGGEA